MRTNVGTLIIIKYQKWINSFIEDFEVNWFINNLYNNIFIDNFEEWSLGNFINIFTESFNQLQWFINNLYNNIYYTNFENWFIQNNYNIQFIETFENGGW